MVKAAVEPGQRSSAARAPPGRMRWPRRSGVLAQPPLAYLERLAEHFAALPGAAWACGEDRRSCWSPAACSCPRWRSP